MALYVALVFFIFYSANKKHRKNQLVVSVRKERFVFRNDVWIINKNWILRERSSHFINNNWRTWTNKTTGLKILLKKSYLTRIYERSRTYEFEIAFIANSLQTEFETLRTVSTLPPPTLAYPDFGIPFQIFTE